MSTTEHIKLVGKDAIKQLLEEATCFEQLANDYTDHNPTAGKYAELKKFADHFRQIAAFIEKKIEQPVPEKLIPSVRTAATLLKQSRHPRTKMRMELLGREISYLEENSDRWLPLKEDFISTAGDCRKIIEDYDALPESVSLPENSDENGYRKAALDKDQRDKELLQQADELFKQTTALKSRQLAELRVDRAATLRQKLLNLNSETERLNEIIDTVPELSKNCREISVICHQIETKLWTKIKVGSLSELEKAIDTADRLIEQVKQGQKQNEGRERATITPSTTGLISMDDKSMEEQMLEILNPSSPIAASNPVKKSKRVISLKEKGRPLLLSRSKKSPIVVSAYLISIVGLVVFFLLNIRELMH